MTSTIEERDAVIKKIQQHEDKLCYYINDEQLRRITTKLYETHVQGMDSKTFQSIKSINDRSDRVSAFLEYIYSSDLKVINCFLDSLQYEFPALYTAITNKKASAYDEAADKANETFYSRLNGIKTNSQPRVSKCCEHEIEVENLKRRIESLEDKNKKLSDKILSLNDNIVKLEYDVRFEKQNVNMLKFLKIERTKIQNSTLNLNDDLEYDHDESPYFNTIYINNNS